jgi:hypothetical protein
MSFLSLKGPTVANPHNPAAQDSHLLISCPTVADTIVLFDYAAGQDPYQGHNTGYDASDGRSLFGAIRRKGNSYSPKRRLELAFLVSSAMILVIEAMLEAQRQGQIITIVDAWDLPITRSMWIDVGERYRTQIAKDRHLLQISAWEI